MALAVLAQPEQCPGGQGGSAARVKLKPQEGSPELWGGGPPPPRPPLPLLEGGGTPNSGRARH
jgi:hypothetical protein